MRFILDRSGWANEVEIIEWDDLVVVERIGAGAYGTVYKAVWHHKEVCIKAFDASFSPAALQSFVEEANVLGQLKHPHCVLFMGVCLDPAHCGVVTEYLDGGDLRQFLRTRPDAPRRTRTRILLESAIGLQYLHSRGFAHRDIKPSNIVLGSNGGPVKLCDFGLAGPKMGVVRGGGTPRYAAPEVLLGEAADLAADVFSFGVVTFEVLSGARAQLRSSNVFDSPIPETFDMTRFDLIPPTLSVLLQTMFSPAPRRRPSMASTCDALVEAHASMWASPSPILLLPEELLSRILTFLPLRERAWTRGVCRAWRSASSDPSLWQGDLDEGLVAESDNMLQLLLRAPYLGVGDWLLSRSSLTVGESVTDTGLNILAAFCYNVTRLDLSRALLVSNSGVRDIVNSLTSLTSINLAACTHLSGDALQHVSQRCPGLTSLDLTRCEQMTDSSLKYIAIGCPQLASIRLGHIPGLTDSTLVFLASCNGLTHLDLTNGEGFTDDGLAVLASSSLLSVCILTGCTQITDLGVRSLLATSPELEVAVFNGCEGLTAGAFSEYLPPLLRSFSLSGCKRMTNAALRALPPSIQALSLSGCSRLSSKGYSNICSAAPVSLTSLSLCGTSVSDKDLTQLLGVCGQHLVALDLSSAVKIGDESLHQIGQFCAQLERLSLSGCTRISDDGLRFVTHGVSTGLVELALDGCKVEDVGLAYISSSLPRLSRLSLSFCSRITDLGLSALAHAPAMGLTSLSLARARLISDEGIATLMESVNWPLVTLDLSECKLLSDSALASVSSSSCASSLESISLSRLPRISVVGLKMLLRSCPAAVVNLSVSRSGLTREQAGLLTDRFGARVVVE